ncbi:class I SAM-dependent methyltransferase [Streptomyces sp. ME18-1-4]|uniref:class I SAM-dependent methyltransferase n=1 Tax=Streptomyces sp. ME18-1-4 TaxID=3028685 RepID=UPI0039F6FD61
MVEIGTFHGWSTTWILQALREDNGTATHGITVLAPRRADTGMPPAGRTECAAGGCSVRASASERGDR